METAEESNLARYINVTVRWHTDRMISWIRRHLPGMAEARIDPDTNPVDAEIYARLERLERRPYGHNYGVNGSNGAGKLTMWILGIFGAVATLLLSLTLQAVFNLRSDVSELRGQVSILVSDRSNNGRRP